MDKSQTAAGNKISMLTVLLIFISFILNQAEDPILSPGRVGMNAINCKMGCLPV